MIAVLAGGVGAARYLVGLSAAVDPASITAVVNTGDDTVMHGLSICPDLDTVTYTLAGATDAERGWGLAGETWQAMGALARFANHRPQGSRAGGTWFNLGDRDLATHLYRTGRLAEGAALSTVTAEIAVAWGLRQRILPMTDDSVRTRVHTADGWLDFQEYFVGKHHDVDVDAVEFSGVDAARPLPASVAAMESADVIVVAPSNPIVSIGPLLALRDGAREVLARRRESVVAVSPIVAGAALKGPAARMLAELGHDSSVVGVARLYAELCATLVVDRADRHLAPEVEAAGVRCIVTDTVMSTPAIAAALAATTLEVSRR